MKKFTFRSNNPEKPTVTVQASDEDAARVTAMEALYAKEHFPNVPDSTYQRGRGLMLVSKEEVT